MSIQNRNTEPRPRHFHRGDTGMPNLTEQQIRKLNDVFDFEDELGIPLDRNGYPRSTKNNAKAPRAFAPSPNSYHVDEVIRQDKLNDPNLTPGQLYDKAQLYSPQALNAAANIMAPKEEQKAIDPPQAAKNIEGPEQEQEQQVLI